MEIVSRVMDLYAQIDKSVAAFQLKSGLRCPPGCGACCPSAHVDVTVLEMLPIAHEILRQGEAAAWLQRLASQENTGRCLLYLAEPQEEVAGHCSYYKWRPALCRLFGFAAVRGGRGEKLLSICKRIKQTDPVAAGAALRLVDQAPCFVHFGTQVYALDPVLGQTLLPINTALRHAIERLGLHFSFTYGETLRDNTAA